MLKAKHGFSFIVAAVFVLLLVACSDEVTEITEVNETGMKVIEEGENMPKCTLENEGALVYALDSATAYACVNREWTSLNGKDGQDGKDGAKGEKGDQGEQGKQGEKGDQGKQGPKGDDGKDGEDGTDCSLADNGDGTVSVTCGDSTIMINKAMCGMEPYDPAKQFCDARDNKVYKYVKIGTQVWMAENLNYAYLQPTEELDSSSLCYNDSSEYCNKYGRLYLWSAAMDSAGLFTENGKGCGDGVTCSVASTNSATLVRGVCPEGWHLPDSTEWTTLFAAVGGLSIAGKKLKSMSGWNNSGNGSDDFAFSALPAGERNFGGIYINEGSYANFWSSTEYSEYGTYLMHLDHVDYAGVNTLSRNQGKISGLSVRCLKN